MPDSTGQLSFILVAAVGLAFAGAWLISWRYRVAMRRLMSAPAQANPQRDAVPTPAAGEWPSPTAVSLASNRRAALRLTLLLVALSCLMAFSSAALLFVVDPSLRPFAIKRVLVFAPVHLWPAIPAIGLLWRWSRRRVLGVLALWCVLCFALALWRSIDPRPLQVLLFLASEIGLPLVLATLLCLGDTTRAIAPWLVLPLAGLVTASLVGLDLLGWLVARQSSLVLWLAGWLDARLALLLFAALPWLLAWWPLRWLGRALGRAYARKHLSELLVLFTALWAIALTSEALVAASTAGPAGAALLLPLLWIPLVVGLDARLHADHGRPPTLLVLRVFQRDAQVQALFDGVVERWRLTGNTVLIAGTDLADRTLDADDIFTFLDGGLAGRFIGSPADVAPRLAAFDLARDTDGRFRVNECYCHDSTWQDALQALVRRSDVVLMDLRGFQAHNAGCRYELGALAQTARPLRVVVLADGQTDRDAAAEAIGHSRAERFVWIDATAVDARKRAEVLASLFGPAA